MKKILIIISLFVIGTAGYAQSDIDALRYSDIKVNGTARTVGVGGSLSALGGDFGAISSNPAGLATFRSKQFVFTPGMSFNSSNSVLDGQENDDQSTKFTLTNIGMVFAKTRDNRKWKTSNFAIGTNRLASFDQRFSFNGTSVGSITERWVEFADGVLPNDLYPFEEGMAYNASIIFNPDDNDPTFYSSDVVDLLDAGEQPLLRKTQTVTSSGGMNELSFSYAANYNHKLSIGASIGIPLIRYTQEKVYRELDDSGTDEIPFFNSLTFNENLTTVGTGVNAKFGLIYRVSQALRIGAAVHSPTIMALSENFSNSISSNLDFGNGSETFSEVSPDGNFQYGLTTPLRISASGAYLFGKVGFVTGEVEFVDYSQMSFDLRTDLNPGELEYEQELNATIADKYGSAMNIKVGGELRLDVFRFRGGLGLFGSPFSNNVSAGSGLQTSLSAGLGVHGRYYYADLGVVNMRRSETYVPYTTLNSPNTIAIDNTFRNNQFILTIGFKF